MKTAVAAAINALSPKGKDYTKSADGKSKATQWRGGKSKSNRYFTSYPPKPSNQITSFQYDQVQ